MIELDIAGENRVAPRSFYDDAHGIRHGVGNAEEPDCRFAKPDYLVFFHLANLHGNGLRKFLLPLLYHHAGQFAGINHRVADAVNDVGNSADVIQMPVRNQHSANFVPALFQVSCIWKYVINTGSLYFAESKSAINDKNVASEFYGCHVSSHLLNSGKGNDAHGVFRRLLDRGIRPTIARIGLMFYARFASSRGVRRAGG